MARITIIESLLYRLDDIELDGHRNEVEVMDDYLDKLEEQIKKWFPDVAVELDWSANTSAPIVDHEGLDEGDTLLIDRAMQLAWDATWRLPELQPSFISLVLH